MIFKKLLWQKILFNINYKILKHSNRTQINSLKEHLKHNEMEIIIEDHVSAHFRNEALLNILLEKKIKASIQNIYSSKFRDDCIYILYSPCFFDNPYVPLPKYYIIYNWEPYNHPWCNNEYYYRMLNALAVIDYSTLNINKFRKHVKKVNFIYLPPPFDIKAAESSFNKNRNTKLLFYGTLRKRRNEILASINKEYDIKIFEEFKYDEKIEPVLFDSLIVLNIHTKKGSPLETVRLCESLSHGCLVISESSPDFKDYSLLNKIVTFTNNSKSKEFIKEIDSILIKEKINNIINRNLNLIIQDNNSYFKKCFENGLMEFLNSLKNENI